MKTYTDLPCSGDVGLAYRCDPRPRINRHHVDGPVVTFRDGQMHWLTPWERFLLFFDLIDCGGP